MNIYKMKLYIDNYNPIKLIDKMNLLNKYLADSKQIIFIYSDDGIFEITNNDMYFLDISNEHTQHITYNPTTIFIVDYTNIKKQTSYYIPVEHYSIETKVYRYRLPKNNNLEFVIYTTKKNDKEIPYDFYFEMEDKEDLTNIFVHKNINVFLSMLN